MESPRDIKLYPSPEAKMHASPIKSPEGSTTKMTRPASSHGIKLSANMSSQAKQDLMLRLEEWRKVKRETMVQSLANKFKETPTAPNKSAKSLSSLKPKTNVTKPNNQQISRESVFERLYRNEKVTRKPEKPAVIIPDKPVQNDSKLFSPEGTQKPANDSCMDHHGPSETTQNDDMTMPDSINKEGPNPTLQSSINAGVNVHQEFLSIQDRGLNEIQEADDDKENKGIHLSPVHQHIVDTGDFSTQNELLSKDDNMGKTTIKDHSGTALPKPEAPDFNPPKETRLPAIKKDNQTRQSTTTKPAIRRSISMLFRRKKSLLRTPSEKNLRELQSLRESSNHPKTKPHSQMKKVQAQKKTVVRPSVLFSPKIRKETTTTVLRNNLEGWLKTNGHSLDNYRHLRCFGIDQPTTPARQKTPEDQKAPTCSPPPENDDKENVSPTVSPTPNNLHDDPKPELWLKELFRLIVDLKYPPERCEEWLAAIRIKCPSCTELPIYWECLSAFKDTKNAPSDDKHEPDASLAEMFDKMVIQNQASSTSKVRLEKGMNPENIFQSTVVKFAVQSSKGGKECSQDTCGATTDSELVATPVRRSSRIKTPAKGTFDSLTLLSSDVSSKVTFKTNQSLLSRF